MREVVGLAGRRGSGELHISTEPGNEAARALYISPGAELVGVQMGIVLE